MSIEVANSAPPPEALAHLVHVRLGEWLTRAGKLSVRDLDRAIGAQQEMGSMLGRVLVRLGLVSEIQLAKPCDRLLACQLDNNEWTHIEAGLKQRIKALNRFIDDVYHDQTIFEADVIPRFVLESCKAFRDPCKGLMPPRKVWCHITGTDLIRGGDGTGPFLTGTSS